jgi:hypothetical protein
MHFSPPDWQASGQERIKCGERILRASRSVAASTDRRQGLAFLSWRLSARKRQVNKVGLIDARPVRGVVLFSIATSILVLSLVVRSPEGVSAPLGFAVLCLTCALAVDKVFKYLTPSV